MGLATDSSQGLNNLGDSSQGLNNLGDSSQGLNNLGDSSQGLNNLGDSSEGLNNLVGISLRDLKTRRHASETLETNGSSFQGGKKTGTIPPLRGLTTGRDSSKGPNNQEGFLSGA